MKRTAIADDSKPTDEDWEDKPHIRDPEQQKKVDNAELIAFIVVALTQLAISIVMATTNFKYFSIIPFFMGPMWVLFAEALCLVVIRIGKFPSLITDYFYF